MNTHTKKVFLSCTVFLVGVVAAHPALAAPGYFVPSLQQLVLVPLLKEHPADPAFGPSARRAMQGSLSNRMW